MNRGQDYPARAIRDPGPGQVQGLHLGSAAGAGRYTARIEGGSIGAPSCAARCALITLSGHAQDEIAIEFTGLRPGEKLFEELLADADTTLPTTVPRLRVARLQGDTDPTQVLDSLQNFSAAGRVDDAAVRQWLRIAVPEYRDG